MIKDIKDFYWYIENEIKVYTGTSKCNFDRNLNSFNYAKSVMTSATSSAEVTIELADIFERDSKMGINLTVTVVDNGEKVKIYDDGIYDPAFSKKSKDIIQSIADHLNKVYFSNYRYDVWLSSPAKVRAHNIASRFNIEKFNEKFDISYYQSNKGRNCITNIAYKDRMATITHKYRYGKLVQLHKPNGDVIYSPIEDIYVKENLGTKCTFTSDNIEDNILSIMTTLYSTPKNYSLFQDIIDRGYKIDQDATGSYHITVNDNIELLLANHDNIEYYSVFVHIKRDNDDLKFVLVENSTPFKAVNTIIDFFDKKGDMDEKDNG